MSSGRFLMTNDRGMAAPKTTMANVRAVPCHPLLLWIAKSINGMMINAPPRLIQLAHPIADAMRRENQLLMVVIMGTQLPIPWPRAIIM